MDPNRGARLLSSLWPIVNATLSDENRHDRLKFISDLLTCFHANGVDITKFMGVDEDIKSAVQHLGVMPPPTEPRKGFTLDTSDLGNPVNYEFVGGPFDGSTLRLGSGLYERPPGRITLSPDDHPTRLNGDTKYKLHQVTEHDDDGNLTVEYLAYEYES